MKQCAWEGPNGKKCGKIVPDRVGEPMFCVLHGMEAKSVAEMRENQVLGGVEKARAVKAEIAARAADDDLATAKLVAQELGLPQNPAPKAVPAYVPATELDDEIQTHRLAIQMLQAQQEQANREAYERKAQGGSVQDTDKGRAAIELKTWRPAKMPDPLAVEDDAGNSLKKPDFDYRWVRVRDLLDDRQENNLRLKRMQAWGAEVVVKPDGTKLRTRCHVCMAIPRAANAARIIEASASGAFDSAKPIADLHNAADAANRQLSQRFHGLGKGVIGVEAMPGHGSRQQEERPFAPEE